MNEDRKWLDKARYRLRALGGYKLSKFPGKELYNVLDGVNRQSVVPGEPGRYGTMTREDVDRFIERTRKELLLPCFADKNKGDTCE